MNKFLSLLWIIIIGGSIYIVVHISRPQSGKENKPVTVKESQTPTKTEEKIIFKDSKTYSEYLASGDNALRNSPKTAIEFYKQAIKLNQNSSEAIKKLANAYLLNNEPEKSLIAFQKAVEFDPNSLDAKIGIVRSNLNSRNIEKAKEILNGLSEDDFKVKYYKAIIEILYKNFDLAKKLLADIKDNSQDPELKIKAEKFLLTFNNFSLYKEAEEIFLYTLLAKTLTNVSEYEASIPLIFDVINTKNNYRDAWIVLGYAYLNTGKTLDAIDSFSQAENLDPNKSETLFFLGLARFANNELDKAIKYLEKAQELGYQPKDQIKINLADIYLSQEDYENAAKYYEEFLKLNTKNIEIYVKAVWLNIDKLNHPEKAKEIAIASLTNHPDKAMSYNLVGWAYEASGEYKDAEEYLKSAIKMDPKFAAAYLNMGILNEKKGSNDLAKKYYKKAYNLDKGNSIGNLALEKYNNLINNSSPL